MFPIDKAKMPGDAREKNYQSTTWSLNPQAYQNVSNDMVDWAALAQQWIQMKETCPSEDMPAAPPPPPLSGSDFEEQGEAPMEVVEKDEEPPVPPMLSVPQGGNQWNPTWNSFRPQNQWRPGWSSWPNPSMVAPPAPSLMRATTAILPGDFRTPPPAVVQQLVAAPAAAWPRARFPAAAILAPTLPEPKVECHVSSAPKSDVNFIQADTTTTIDAAKRKNLPAWIREGLEKMERAKQRQAEKEREEQERREEIEKRRQVEEATLKELERMKKEEEEEGAKLPVKSKFESDTDSETDGEISDRRPRRGNDSSRSRSPEVKKAEVVKKTMEEVMLDVRKTLTEILLEVTNEEILDVAKETVARAQKKRPKVIVGQSSNITTSNLPASLGLAIYGSSDSEGDETDNDENTQGSGKNEDSDGRDSADSDLELQEKIKRQVNAFKKTSREIEEQLAEEDEREERRRLEREEREQRRKLSFYDAKNNGNVEKNRDGETEQLDRNSTKAGKSSRPKKQSRFSDPKDTVRGTHLTHVSILGAYKSDALAAGLSKLRQVGEALEAAAERSSSSSRSAMVTTLASRTGSSSHAKGSRSRRRSDSSSDDDDEVSSTSSSNSNRRRRRRSRSSDRHSRHSHSSHSSRRTRSRSRSRERKADRRSRY
ncbi:arginine/serine-rich protein PNISR isoform X2 [Lutzomyia longipalpis]|uniref:arginine/serine-rich protein PNISR isoform X2 n=1 Tax=Lutzomyia longipalpis TaxID=7200 RepID=UPI002483BB2A|nr:arginine/serine-rich protein PNISR isoform X2 [Lutzomyia longipalpis]